MKTVRRDFSAFRPHPLEGSAMNSFEDVHFEGSNRLFVAVWLWLLGLTAVEVFLAYIHVPVHLMLTILLGLSVVKAALIMAYFMHLRFERLSLVLTLVPVLVLCICLLLVFFPDSVRLLNLRVYR
jgi:cytochrome c oxidase subunit 4